MDMIVIGGGLAGLVAAYEAKKKGLKTALFESSNRVGGVIRSERENGYLLEFGPNTVPLTAELFELARELGLEAEIQIADLRTPRYVLFQGKLHRVPMSPPALLTTGLLSFSGKLRLLKEPFVPARKDSGDETLISFSKRRLGEEPTTRLLAPFVSGIWAGDVAQLSAPGAFPKLAEWEKKHGSVLLGALFSPKKKGPRGLLSFRNGIESLTRALAGRLVDEITTNAKVNSLQRDGSGWKLNINGTVYGSKQVMLCTPTAAAAALVTPFAQEAAFTLNQIPYAGLTVLHFGFERQQIERPWKGFGFLCAPSEKSDILGCLWNANLFPGRAPTGAALWTVFMGGMTNPAVLTRPDNELAQRALTALRPVMGLKGDPKFQKITRYERAIPQYTMGHNQRMRTLVETEQQNPGLRFMGNYRSGISVGDVVRQGQTL